MTSISSWVPRNERSGAGYEVRAGWGGAGWGPSTDISVTALVSQSSILFCWCTCRSISHFWSLWSSSRQSNRTQRHSTFASLQLFPKLSCQRNEDITSFCCRLSRKRSAHRSLGRDKFCRAVSSAPGLARCTRQITNGTASLRRSAAPCIYDLTAANVTYDVASCCSTNLSPPCPRPWKKNTFAPISFTRSDRLGPEFLSTAGGVTTKSDFHLKNVFLNLPTMPKQKLVNMPTKITGNQSSTQKSILINVNGSHSPEVWSKHQSNESGLSAGVLASLSYFSKYPP